MLVSDPYEAWEPMGLPSVEHLPSPSAYVSTDEDLLDALPDGRNPVGFVRVAKPPRAGRHARVR